MVVLCITKLLNFVSNDGCFNHNNSFYNTFFCGVGSLNPAPYVISELKFIICGIKRPSAIKVRFQLLWKNFDSFMCWIRRSNTTERSNPLIKSHHCEQSKVIQWSYLLYRLPCRYTPCNVANTWSKFDIKTALTLIKAV